MVKSLRVATRETLDPNSIKKFIINQFKKLVKLKKIVIKRIRIEYDRIKLKGGRNCKTK